jgi:hypothetical protein
MSKSPPPSTPPIPPAVAARSSKKKLVLWILFYIAMALGALLILSNIVFRNVMYENYDKYLPAEKR